MEQYLEFAGNHPFLIGAFIITAGMAVFLEIQRKARGGGEVSPSAAVRLHNDDGVFIDIRDVGEYRNGHVINAMHIPQKELPDRLRELEKYRDKPVVLYCATGLRSAKATGVLSKNGFNQAFSLAGGLQAWEKASLPLESS